jgi:hypothetical protein
MTGDGRISSSSGVSETIGFVIILGIVMTGIAIVTLYGYPALLQEQSNSNIKNMQKNMLVLQSDIKSLTFKSVPYQETAMQVSGGTLMIKKDPNTPPAYPYFKLNIGGTSQNIEIGELRFESSDGQATVTLENGAVHMRYWSSPTGSAMLSEPSWYYDAATNTYVIQMIRMNATSDMAQTGIGTVKMQLSDSNQSLPITTATGDYIQYYHSSAYHYGTAWNNYLKNPELALKETPSGSGKYEFTPGSQLIIKYYNVTFLSL